MIDVLQKDSRAVPLKRVVLVSAFVLATLLGGAFLPDAPVTRAELQVAPSLTHLANFNLKGTINTGPARWKT